ncbi:endonuclease/exonuclease/phosphatase family protein [Enterococcus hermanniensis]|uniref:Endonuclease/exonuclease/phosphatase domain-containing protein n=1 Tax=Enterococcus hermanniensis TaxID=249189 RepID=A0A1L8TPJ4_9ENTE|nr:endonuclease/exonuclease/phosphatase family protein [Enterococcus hermanniensis]OJG46042.1 hypothetical protein RV04_GL001808 [Enterococcus hermanniensis]
MENKDEEQIEVLVGKIIKEEYEVVGLQEINQLINSSSIITDKYFQATNNQQTVHEDNFLYRLIQRLNELGHYYYWSWTFNHIGYEKYQEGVGLLSKVPFDKVESLLISKTSNPTDYHTRKVMIGELTIANRTVIVVSGHFSWWKDQAFYFEWKKLEQRLIIETKDLIVLGDFNNDAKIKEEGYDLIKNSPLQLQDAFKEAKKITGEYTVEKSIDGWVGNLSKLRIDYIFTSKSFLVRNYKIVFNDKNETKISDHYGVEVEVG